MGVDPYNLVSALNGVVAQRLVRIVCPHCSTPDEPGAERIEASALPDIPLGWSCRGIGCAHCRGTGYKGRRAIAQTLAMDVGLRSLIAERASPAALRQTARSAACARCARPRWSWWPAAKPPSRRPTVSRPWKSELCVQLGRGARPQCSGSRPGRAACSTSCAAKARRRRRCPPP